MPLIFNQIEDGSSHADTDTMPREVKEALDFLREKFSDKQFLDILLQRYRAIPKIKDPEAMLEDVKAVLTDEFFLRGFLQNVEIGAGLNKSTAPENRLLLDLNNLLLEDTFLKAMLSLYNNKKK